MRYLLVLLLALSSFASSAQFNQSLEGKRVQIQLDNESMLKYNSKAIAGRDQIVIGSIISVIGITMLQASKWNENYNSPAWNATGYTLALGGGFTAAVGTYNFASNKWSMRKLEKKYN